MRCGLQAPMAAWPPHLQAVPRAGASDPMCGLAPAAPLAAGVGRGGQVGFSGVPPVALPQVPVVGATPDHSPGTSARGAGPEVGGVVPVEYANSRLWGVTSEYENLLNIQRDQHQLALRRGEAEVARLRGVVALLDGDEGPLAAGLRGAEAREAALAVEAKQKELELFAALLRMRDRQISDLQELCEVKQEHISRLQGGCGGGHHHLEAMAPALASTAASTVSASAAQLQPREAACVGEHGSTRNDRGAAMLLLGASPEVETLRREKAELERLIIAKDRQLEAFRAVDPSMGDAPALQLGVQAIQMFHESLRRKQEEAGCARENQQLREEVDHLRSKLEELEAANAEKRGEIKEMTSALTSKMQKVFELETDAEAAQHEKRQATREASAQLEQMQEELTAWQRDCRATQQLVEELKSELAERDRRLLRQQEDCASQKAHGMRLQRQVEDMGVQLASAEETITHMLHNNSYKDQLVREMTEKVNISETKLHTFQINELLSSRQKRRSSDLPAAAATQSQREPSAERGEDAPPPWPWPRPSDTRPSEPVAEEAPAAWAAAARARAQGSQGSRAASPVVAEKPMAASGQDGPSLGSRPSYQAVSAAAPVGSTAALDGSAAGIFAQTYRPHPGDPVDLRLADFVNQPRNSVCRALFCRLGEGSYLYGTQRASLRVWADQLEALLGRDWVPLAEFMHHMQGTQGIHLQRAQEVACGNLSSASALGSHLAPLRT